MSREHIGIIRKLHKHILDAVYDSLRAACCKISSSAVSVKKRISGEKHACLFNIIAAASYRMTGSAYNSPLNAKKLYLLTVLEIMNVLDNRRSLKALALIDPGIL